MSALHNYSPPLIFISGVLMVCVEVQLALLKEGVLVVVVMVVLIEGDKVSHSHTLVSWSFIF